MLSKIQQRHNTEQDRLISERYAILGPRFGSIKQIAEEFEVSRQTVYNALKRYKTGKKKTLP